jgi:hypothetical protein
VYAWALGDDRDAGERARRAAALLPDGAAVGGWAAAALHGATDLDGQSLAGAPLPVLLCLSRRDRCRRTRDVVVFRSDLEDDDVVVVEGVPVTSVIRTCFDLARLAATLEDAVVAVDALARGVDVDLGAVGEYAQARHRYRGAARARRALTLADPASASCPESRLRMVWILGAGLPMPLVNPEVRWDDGVLIGRPDLLDPAVGLAGEYDGGYHADAERRALDHHREEGFERAGMIVVRAAWPDLGPGRRRLVHRLQMAHADAARRDRGSRRWRVA